MVATESRLKNNNYEFYCFGFQFSYKLLIYNSTFFLIVLVVLFIESESSDKTSNPIRKGIDEELVLFIGGVINQYFI